MSTLLHHLSESSQRRRARRAEQTASWLPRWRNRRSRRRLCGALAASLLATTLGALLVLVAGDLETRAVAVAFAVLWVGGIVAAMACWVALQVLTGHVGELPTGVLDEREVAARNAARAQGFQVGIVAALVPMLYLLLTSSPGEPSTTAYPGALLVAVAIFAGAFSPTAIVAWRQVDDEPDEIGPGEQTA
ncbi:hypothetical protein GCM10027047_30160 [Rhodococcus aerolatus]